MNRLTSDQAADDHVEGEVVDPGGGEDKIVRKCLSEPADCPEVAWRWSASQHFCGDDADINQGESGGHKLPTESLGHKPVARHEQQWQPGKEGDRVRYLEKLLSHCFLRYSLGELAAGHRHESAANPTGSGPVRLWPCCPHRSSRPCESLLS